MKKRITEILWIGANIIGLLGVYIAITAYLPTNNWIVLPVLPILDYLIHLMLLTGAIGIVFVFLKGAWTKTLGILYMLSSLMFFSASPGLPPSLARWLLNDTGASTETGQCAINLLAQPARINNARRSHRASASVLSLAL